MTRRTLLLALCLLAAIAPVSRAAADPPWVRVTSENFVIYSDAGEKRARAIAERLEGFRALLASLFPDVIAASHTDQVPVVAFRNDDAFKVYKPLYNGKTVTSVAGLFLNGNEQSLIALDASAWEGTSHVIFHEYLHRLLSRSDKPVPVWFNEGVAEFYSTATTESTKGQIGKVVPGHLNVLADRGLMPLEVLFSVSHDSPEYNEKNRQSVFYAESWAFVHYCILDGERQRSKALTEFAQRQGRGEPVASAFKAAFGRDTTAMEKELRSYVRQSAYPILNVTFPAPRAVAETKIEPAPGVEVEYYLGNALALQRRYDEAEPHYRRAMEADPASALPHEGMGFVALQRKDIASARAAFSEATRRDSKSFMALYYFALSSMGSSDEATISASRAALERAVSLNPSFAGSYELLAVLAFQADDVKAAGEWAARGLRIAPQNGRLRVNLASAQAHQGKLDDAKKNLHRVVDTSDDESARAYARTLLESLDRPNVVASTGGETIVRTEGPLTGAGDGAPTVLDRPRLTHRSGVQGLITRIDLQGTKMTVRIVVDGKEMTFTSEDADNVILSTSGFTTEEETITLNEPLNRKGTIYFDPDPADPNRGVLRSIILEKPGT